MKRLVFLVVLAPNLIFTSRLALPLVESGHFHGLVDLLARQAFRRVAQQTQLMRRNAVCLRYKASDLLSRHGVVFAHKSAIALILCEDVTLFGLISRAYL